MSCYAWERGEIKLPSGYAPKLRARLTEVAEGHIQKLIAETNFAWDRLKTVPAAKRQAALWKLNISPTFRAETPSVRAGRNRASVWAVLQPTW